MEKFYFAIIGPASVGKSALALRYCRNMFQEDYVCTTEDTYRREISFDGANGPKTELNILDTAGLEDFVAMRANWISNKDGLVLVFSVDKREVFEGMEVFYNEILHIYPNKDIPLVLVANKIDLGREITKQEGEEMARRFGAEYFECSAKSGENVAEFFGYLVRQARIKRGLSLPQKKSVTEKFAKPPKGFCDSCKLF